MKNITLVKLFHLNIVKKKIFTFLIQKECLYNCGQYSQKNKNISLKA